MLLAGRAAERELLGEISGGAGGGAQSDLARATELATRALGGGGLGQAPGSLLWHEVGTSEQVCRVLRHDALLQRRVRAALDAAAAAAEALMMARRDTVEAIATALLNRSELSATEIREMAQLSRALGGPCGTH
jgi:ATP-dependent Zn protease